jgi:hypothetical protein
MSVVRVLPGLRGPFRWMVASVLAAVFAGCSDGAQPPRAAPELASRAAPSSVRGATPVTTREAAIAFERSHRADELQRWAVNALLYTILDDDRPPRWTDPEVWAGCAPGTQVRVNHRPLVVGEHIPTGAFDLSWDAVDCHPLGLDGPAMNGRVTLRLKPSGADGWVAQVATDGLEWAGPHGRTMLPSLFVASAPASALAASRR